MFKNVAGQKVPVFAYDTNAQGPKTGDAANITGQISSDGASPDNTDDTNPTELDALDAPGIYIFDLLQAETNGDLVILSPSSITSNIVLEPVFVYTVTPLYDLTFVKNVMEGDMTVDTTQTPWQRVIKIKSTATELIRKDIKTPAGVDITSAASIVGQTVES